MADNNYIHTAEIMKAASPHLNVKMRVTVDLLSKFLDFMGSYQLFHNKDNLAACGFEEDDKLDMKGLLKSIRPLCNKNEIELVDRFLGIFQAQEMFTTMNTFMDLMKSMQGDDENSNPFGSFDFGNMNFGNMNFDQFDFSNLNFDNFNFGGFTQATEADTTKTETTETDQTDTVSEDSEHIDFASTDTETIPGSSNSDTIEPDSSSSNRQDYYNEHKDETGSNTDTTSDSETTEQTNQQDHPQQDMFGMLQSFISPEQLKSIQNLSMLFNNMSYDDNDKPDEYKE